MTSHVAPSHVAPSPVATEGRGTGHADKGGNGYGSRSEYQAFYYHRVAPSHLFGHKHVTTNNPGIDLDARQRQLPYCRTADCATVGRAALHLLTSDS